MPRLLHAVVGLLVGAGVAYLGMPSKTARTLVAQQRADQNWAQLGLEQIAAQIQIAAELARGMALTLEHTSNRSEPELLIVP